MTSHGPKSTHSPYGVYTRHGGANRDWMIQAACRDHDPETFFPLPSDRRGLVNARNICRACPVAQQCADYADRLDVSYGIWAGHLRNRTVSTGYADPSATERAPGPIPECGTERAYRRHLRRGENPDTACKKAAVEAWHQRKTERSTS